MTDKQPLVSVICLCYNHSKYVVEAMESVLTQSYPNIELIVVDDASTDKSVEVINSFVADKPGIRFIPLMKNIGNCKAFNYGWQASSGEFIIDFAADDLMLPERLALGVDRMLKQGPDFGVHFTDALIIDESGQILREHRTQDIFAGEVPQGNIFKDLLSKYFINPVTMMYSRPMLEYLGGYDEELAYEDFDVWVRSSKKFKYCYTDKTLMAKRVLKNSHGSKQYQPFSKILLSTYRVCKKAFLLCENVSEYKALKTRLKYEFKRSFFSMNWHVALNLFQLLKETNRKINASEF